VTWVGGKFISNSRTPLFDKTKERKERETENEKKRKRGH